MLTGAIKARQSSGKETCGALRKRGCAATEGSAILKTALNHMAAPQYRHDALMALAGELGCVGVEFRNDLNRPLFHGDCPETVAVMMRTAGLRLLALSEIKAFNDWSDAKRDEAARLIATAAACGAEAVSLIPRNDGRGLGNGERQANLRLSLRELAPMLAEAGLTGLVEPLGFESCALRCKAEAVEAIEAVAPGRFSLTHDTFHHYLSGEDRVFAAHTGIVHVSGVTDRRLGTFQMRDAHRGLVDAEDRLDSVVQIAALRQAGYDGPVSLEPFAAEVHAMDAPDSAFARTFDFIRERLAEPVA